jgi:arylsulfatase A-like enzyme
MDGMLIASGPGVRASHELSSARIIDLAPTILAIMGVPIPEDMDGQILTDAFIPDTQVDLQVGYQKPQHNVLAGSADLSEQAEDEILDRLRGLGYVE